MPASDIGGHKLKQDRYVGTAATRLLITNDMYVCQKRTQKLAPTV
jgi:hypothetical protein